VSTIECGDVRIENLGDGVRGGAWMGETEAGGLEELVGDRDGGETAELCNDRAEVGDGTRSTSLIRLPSTDGRLLGPSSVRDTPFAGLCFAVLAFLNDSSLRLCGGETEAEVASVGVYALGGEIGAEVGSSRCSSLGGGPETSFVVEGTLTRPRPGVVTPLTSGRLGSLSEILPSTMGVSARRIAASDPGKPMLRGGTCGRGRDPSCGAPLPDPSVEGMEVIVDKWELCDLEAALCEGT